MPSIGTNQADLTTLRSENVSWNEALRVWIRLALLSFGGPAGQIAVMHRIVVEEKRWISEPRFLHALNFCMLLPGPEAQQLATYIGWLMHRAAGGILAGGLFVLPGALSVLALSYAYAAWGQLPIITALFFGLKAAVLAVVVEAVVRIGRRALRNHVMVAVSALAFVAIFFFAVPFPIIVVSAAAIGFLGYKPRPSLFGQTGEKSAATDGASDETTALGEEMPGHARPKAARLFSVAALWLALWLIPVAVVIIAFGADNVFAQIAVFFSKMALVTFGGAYAVLAYVAQQAVEHYGWLKPTEMLDGLGMAETTPGPLIMVLQFVGFMAAFRDPGTLSPMLAATLGALLTTWVTFTPCFLWIFLGAPFIESLRGNHRLSAALSAVTAAVVGVILNLALCLRFTACFARCIRSAALASPLTCRRLQALTPGRLCQPSAPRSRPENAGKGPDPGRRRDEQHAAGGRGDIAQHSGLRRQVQDRLPE